MVPQNESFRAPNGNIIEKVQDLDDSTNETDQDRHWKCSSRKKQKVFAHNGTLSLGDLSFSTLPDNIDTLVIFFFFTILFPVFSRFPLFMRITYY